jgi:hypothetical protein
MASAVVGRASAAVERASAVVVDGELGGREEHGIEGEEK